MSIRSPPDFREARLDMYDLPTGTTSASAGPSTGPSTGGMTWTNSGPMFKMEDAVVETVVTHTTRTITHFAPIQLPRIPSPECLAFPQHLEREVYPLALEPSPLDLRSFGLNIGGRRVTVQEEGHCQEDEEEGQPAGFSRIVPRDGGGRKVAEKIGLLQAFSTAKGKEVRKRPHDFSRPAYQGQEKLEVTKPRPTGEGSSTCVRYSPPRKKFRGLEELNTVHQDNSLLSPLPSPEREDGPSSTSSGAPPPPTIGSGLEVAALFSLPAIVANFEKLPDRLQQHVLMHLLRRSRMPTIQRASAFASIALKRDFIGLLPHEVAVQILKKVYTKSLAVAARVNKKWRKMIDSERAVWQQRLVDDDMWHGLGVENEEEDLVQRRMEVLDWKAKQPRFGKADTPTDDESVRTVISPRAPPVERPAALKHVYRRRHVSNRNWLTARPEHITFPGHGTNVVTCLQFDEDKIVSASDDHSINIYTTMTGHLRKRLDGHEGGVWALEYSGDTLVSGSTDRTVRIWDLESLTETHCFHGHTSTVRCLQIINPAFDPATGENQPPVPWIVTGSRDATLRVWKLPKKGEAAKRSSRFEELDGQLYPDENPWHIHCLEGHTQAVRALAAHGRICVSGSYDTTVRVWDIVKGTCLHVLTGHEQKVYSIVYDRFRKRCASGSMDNTVKVWDITTGECLHTLTGHTSLVGLLGQSPNFIVSAAADASLRIWDANTHELKHTLASHAGAITCFRHDETKVVSGSDGTLKLWDIRTGQYVTDLVIGISSVWQVDFHGNLLVAASNRGGTTVYDVFDFGARQVAHPSGIDDDCLDRLRGPPWARRNPHEPQTYQVDDTDDLGLDLSSPVNLEARFRSSPDISEISRSRYNNAVSRRSTRLASRAGPSRTASGSSAAPSTSSLYALIAQGRARRLAMRRDPDSPTPAGPSGSSHFGRSLESFVPVIDDSGDDTVDDTDEV